VNGNNQVILLALLAVGGIGAYLYVDGNRQAAQIAAAKALAATSAQASAGTQLQPTGNVPADVLNGIQSGIKILDSATDLFSNIFG
jgi:hypothetical protein